MASTLSASLDDNRTKEDNIESDASGVGDEGWDSVRKRIKLEFVDAKGKGKVSAKSAQSKVHYLIFLYIIAPTYYYQTETPILDYNRIFGRTNRIPDPCTPLLSTLLAPQFQAPDILRNVLDNIYRFTTYHHQATRRIGQPRPSKGIEKCRTR
jgi:hypothetical protein